MKWLPWNPRGMDPESGAQAKFSEHYGKAISYMEYKKYEEALKK